MERHITVLLALSLLSISSAQTGTQVYTVTTSNTAILLQWTEAGGQLKGTAQAVSATPQVDGPHIVVVNSGLSGTRSGMDYSFNFDKPILGLGVASAPARVELGNLVISIPLESGGLTTLKLGKSTLTKFNDAIFSLKTMAAKQSISLLNSVVVKQNKDKVNASILKINQLVSSYEADSLNLVKFNQDASQFTPLLIKTMKDVNIAYKAQECEKMNSILADFGPKLNEISGNLDYIITLTSGLKSSYKDIQDSILDYKTSLGELQKRLLPSEVSKIAAVHTADIARAEKTLRGTDAIIPSATSTFESTQKSLADFLVKANNIDCIQR